MYDFDSAQIGIGTEIPNAWAFDTAQFDNILKKLKVVYSVSYLSYCVYSNFPFHIMVLIEFFHFIFWQQAVEIKKDEGIVVEKDI